MVLMRGDRATPAALLSALYGVSGLLCLATALRPMRSGTPVGLVTVLAAVGLGGGAAIWLLRARLRPWVLHAAVGLISVLVGVLAWRSVTAVGIVGLGPVLITVALYAAHFFPLRAARLHAVLLVVAASAGAVAARPSGFVQPWLAVVVSVLVLAEAQGRLARTLRTAAATDPLTGVANRRAWEAEAERNLARAARTGEPLTFAILDLDDFKEVNDREGHPAGDLLLRDLAAGWSRRLRRADLLGRYGGDEFVLCLPATDESGTWEFLAQLDATNEFAWSVGVATARPGDTVADVLARADADLYQQKRSGRRR
jgi:diguanylate cyclase (GGDEF)-like protein